MSFTARTEETSVVNLVGFCKSLALRLVWRSIGKRTLLIGAIEDDCRDRSTE